MSKAIFVTGAASGTGYTIACLFASRGYDVFITSRSKSGAEKSAAEIAERYGVFTKGYECAPGDEEQVKEIFADIDYTGRTVETLVLNAANLGFDPKDPAAGQDFWTVSVEDFRNVFETNLVWNFTTLPTARSPTARRTARQRAASTLLQRRSLWIWANTASGATRYSPAP